MRANFEASLALVIVSEGGFVNDPRDPGGMTNLGCTRRVLEAHKGCAVDEATMRALTVADVAPIYKDKYWDMVAADLLPLGLDYAVFDCAINSGPRQAAKLLQQVLDVHDDGLIGPATLAAVAAHEPADLIAAFSGKRLKFLKHLKLWSRFGVGWGRRVLDVARVATAMA